MKSNHEHHLLLVWLILTGTLVFALFLIWYHGILQLLLSVDKSRISWAIIFIYLLVTLHCAKRVYTVSLQANLTQKVSEMVIGGEALSTDSKHNQVIVDGKVSLPECIATSCLRDLHCHSQSRSDIQDDKSSNLSSLLEACEAQLKGPQEIGWFTAEIMLKMGLLGTIIGFIFMLGSVANITDFDIGSMQKILKHMSTGMGTALYTTLAGLICSILASLQYQMIDRHSDNILETTRHLIYVYALPRFIRK